MHSRIKVNTSPKQYSIVSYLILFLTVESVNFDPPLVTELNAEPPPARYSTAAGQPWDTAMEVRELSFLPPTLQKGKWGIDDDNGV